MIKEHYVDFCVVGGGLAGVCAAVAAARHGIKVAIMQDRPVFGGNASSEIRMWVCGATAQGKGVRETGILEEITLDNFYRNTSLSYTVWDSVIYEKVRFEPNITVMLLNCTCQQAEMQGSRIVSVTGYQTTTQLYHRIHARYFADCSGDSVLAPLTGALYRHGREAESEFGESIAPDTADRKTMGMSCLMQIRETDSPKPFIPPAWAYKYETDEMLKDRPHDCNTNFWWIELGGDRDSIEDTEQMRDELLKIAFGVWDHMKNYGDHGVENWELDWIGFLPGKRESRRYVGDYIVTENDVRAAGKFDDIIAYGGWTMDNHFPEGFYYDGGHPTIYHPTPSPWGIPFRSIYSKNIENLFFAGRNISVTHAALSSSRVMGTCSLLGQAAGTAAAIAVRDDVPIRKIDVHKLQQQLMYDDCYLPWQERELSELTKKASTNAQVLRNGRDRAEGDVYNGFVCDPGEFAEYRFDSLQSISQIRLIFDSDLDRTCHNMPCNYPLHQTEYKTPRTLVKAYRIEAETETGWETIADVRDNCQRHVRHDLDIRALAVRFIPTETWGDDKCRLFSMDIC